jgi:hypothetical protein
MRISPWWADSRVQNLKEPAERRGGVSQREGRHHDQRRASMTALGRLSGPVPCKARTRAVTW